MFTPDLVIRGGCEPSVFNDISLSLEYYSAVGHIFDAVPKLHLRCNLLDGDKTSVCKYHCPLRNTVDLAGVW